MSARDKLNEALASNSANIVRFDRVIAIDEKYSDIHPSETVWTEDRMNLSVRSAKTLQSGSITFDTEYRTRQYM